ncbi:hypothetical protein ASPTUDRAFT_877846 [Aspergillus tubingensis CBS 134.48]|uniref:Uncharacterized protein n=1 Tax=Aspergillus tubingensis (strain CBS 134.48) TaxID=767770 RepID=A0A1L9MQM0_ASPTC|nr:hypothetical protein ASPTUDRAFT_877846 [Aspergillus tubingensis CBS 134.48]
MGTDFRSAAAAAAAAVPSHISTTEIRGIWAGRREIFIWGNDCRWAARQPCPHESRLNGGRAEAGGGQDPFEEQERNFSSLDWAGYQRHARARHPK